jgi:hypothetical protein
LSQNPHAMRSELFLRMSKTIIAPSFNQCLSSEMNRWKMFAHSFSNQTGKAIILLLETDREEKLNNSYCCQNSVAHQKRAIGWVVLLGNTPFWILLSAQNMKKISVMKQFLRKSHRLKNSKQNIYQQTSKQTYRHSTGRLRFFFIHMKASSSFASLATLPHARRITSGSLYTGVARLAMLPRAT